MAKNAGTSQILKNPAKKLGSAILNHAFDVAFVGVDVVSNMKSGDSFGGALVKSVGLNMVQEAFPGVFWGSLAGQMLGAGISAGYGKIKEREQWMYNNYRAQPQFKYVDTEAAYTMRSAAVQAIQGSKLNARSALGGEARLLQPREAYNRL